MYLIWMCTSWIEIFDLIWLTYWTLCDRLYYIRHIILICCLFLFYTLVEYTLFCITDPEAFGLLQQCLWSGPWYTCKHHSDVIMSAVVSQITGFSFVCSTLLFRHKSKKTSKLRVTGLCEGNPPVTGGFPSERVSNAENVSMWWLNLISVSAHNKE